MKYCKKLFALLAAALLCMALYIFTGYHVGLTQQALLQVTSPSAEKSVISFYVLDSDPAETLFAAAGYTFGILKTQDRTNTDQTLRLVSQEGADAEDQGIRRSGSARRRPIWWRDRRNSAEPGVSGPFRRASRIRGFSWTAPRALHPERGAASGNSAGKTPLPGTSD